MAKDRDEKSGYSQRITANKLQQSYQVKPGETMASIAASAGISPEELARVNRGATPLDVGQTIRLPRFDEESGPRRSSRFDTEQGIPTKQNPQGYQRLNAPNFLGEWGAREFSALTGAQPSVLARQYANKQYQYSAQGPTRPSTPATPSRGQEGGLTYAGLNAKPMLGSVNSLLGSEASLTPTQGMVRIGPSFVPQTAVIQDKNGNSTFLNNVFKPADIAEYAIFNNISVQQARQILVSSGYTNVNGTFILQGAELITQGGSSQTGGGSGYGGKIIPGENGQYARINAGIIGNNWQVVTKKINGQWVRVTEATHGQKGRGGRGGGVGRYGGDRSSSQPPVQYDQYGNPIVNLTLRASTG